MLSLESHRHKAMIVGENLGTVPGEVYEAMDRREVLGMYVVQYELQPGSQGLREPPAKSAASLNTHDMPTFQAFWQAKDVDDLQNLGFPVKKVTLNYLDLGGYDPGPAHRLLEHPGRPR